MKRFILTMAQKSAKGVVDHAVGKVSEALQCRKAEQQIGRAGNESWLRRRLRSVVWKHWKQGRTRFRELRKRGVGKDLAAQTAGSAHGPWRIANSPALSLALPNAYFDALGLPAMVIRS
jgi:hypothetical protein